VAGSKWQAIKLEPKEEKEYKRLIFKLLSVDSYEDFNPVYNKRLDSSLAKILPSKKYSFDFKRKFIFQTPVTSLSLSWACENLETSEMNDFVMHFLSGTIYNITTRDIEVLYTSENFKQTIDTEFNSLNFLVLKLAQIDKVDQEAWTALIQWMVDDNLMHLKLAELICLFQEKGTLFPKKDADLWEQRITPLTAWARETYNLGDVPDNWVVKFLLGSATDSLNPYYLSPN